MELREIQQLLRTLYGGVGVAQSPYALYKVLIDGGYLKPGDPLPTYQDTQRLLANPEDVNEIKPAKEQLAAEGLVTYTTGDRAYVAGAPPKLTRGDRGFGKTKEEPKERKAYAMLLMGDEPIPIRWVKTVLLSDQSEVLFFEPKAGNDV